MNKFPSVTSYVIDRLQTILNHSADFTLRQYAKDAISQLRSSKIGGPAFAKIHVKTYEVCKTLRLDWDESWTPVSIRKTRSYSSTNPCAEIPLPKQESTEKLNPLHLI